MFLAMPELLFVQPHSKYAHILKPHNGYYSKLEEIVWNNEIHPFITDHLFAFKDHNRYYISNINEVIGEYSDPYEPHYLRAV